MYLCWWFKDTPNWRMCTKHHVILNIAFFPNDWIGIKMWNIFFIKSLAFISYIEKHFYHTLTNSTLLLYQNLLRYEKLHSIKKPALKTDRWFFNVSQNSKSIILGILVIEERNFYCSTCQSIQNAFINFIKYQIFLKNR